MHKTTAWDSAIDEGKVNICREILLELGRQRFGDPPPKAVEALSEVEDPNRLKRMVEVILNAKSWKALLAVK